MSLVKTFPPTLPCALREGNSTKPKATFERTEMENGIARQRRIFKSTPTIISVQWKFTTDEYEQFANFIDDDLEGGVYWFNVPLRGRFGVKDYKARLVNDPPYEASFGNGRWSVSTTLETLDRI